MADVDALAPDGVGTKTLSKNDGSLEYVVVRANCAA